MTVGKLIELLQELPKEDLIQESVKHGIKYWVPTSNEGYFIEEVISLRRYLIDASY